MSASGVLACGCGDVSGLARERFDGLLPRGLGGRAPSPRCVVRAWAESGGMWLTGHPGCPPLVVDADVLVAAEAAVAFGRAEFAMANTARPEEVGTLLFGRAGLLGLSRAGRRSPGGSCRLVRSADGWAAVNLARPDDIASIPAILERDVVDEPERELEEAAGSMRAEDLAARAQLLGVPGAALGGGADVAPLRFKRVGEPGAAPPRPLVVDLSSLWAGPLCAHLLGLGGADIIKVESTSRPDGARAGPRAVFDWLHGGHRSVVLDFATDSGRALLRRLVRRADVVIEASRPRALLDLGVDSHEVVADGRGKTWLSITGYGREGSAADLVAFGDDAAVAGGLVARDVEGDPVFFGDAIADPLAGIYAAAAVRSSLAAGGGYRVDVAMSGVAAHVAGAHCEVGPHRVRQLDEDAWVVDHGGEVLPVVRPPTPPAGSPADALGASTRAVLAELAET